MVFGTESVIYPIVLSAICAFQVRQSLFVPCAARRDGRWARIAEHACMCTSPCMKGALWWHFAPAF